MTVSSQDKVNGTLVVPNASTVPPADTQTLTTSAKTSELSWRQAVSIRYHRHRREARSHIDRLVRQHKAAKRWKIVAFIVVVCLFAWLLWLYYSKPTHDAAQDTQIKSLQRQVAVLENKGFPFLTAASVAHLTASHCLYYDDQLTNDQIQTLSNDCGWNGHGVANISELYYDQDPNLVAGTLTGSYAAMPFRVQMTNASAPLLYYVPVRQTGPNAVQVAGQGEFFVSAPGLMVTSGTVDQVATSARDNPMIATVTQFLAGASRYTASGVTIPISNSALKVAGATNFVIYTGTPQSRIASALVTYKGPTQDTQFTQRIAFKLSQASTGDWVVDAIGPDINTSLAVAGG